MDDFFEGRGEEFELALDILKREYVTLKQMIHSITDEDLEEVGIKSETRKAILARAEVTDSLFTCISKHASARKFYSFPGPQGRGCTGRNSAKGESGRWQ